MSIASDYWKTKIRRLWETFTNLHFQHVYREFNNEANDLSKQTLNLVEGLIHFEELRDSRMMSEGTHFNRGLKTILVLISIIIYLWLS